MKSSVKLFFCIALCLLMITGCSSKKNTDKNENKESFTFGYLDNKRCYSKDFAIYYSRDNISNSMLPMYYDAESQTKMVFCDKPECKHNKSTCFALKIEQLTSSSPVYIYNDKLYFYGIDDDPGNENGFFYKKLYCSDINGDNLTALATMENLVTVSKNCYFADNKFFFVYLDKDEIVEEKDENGNIHKDLGNEKNPYEIGLYIYDHKTNELKKIVLFTDQFTSSVTDLTWYDGKLYFLDTYYDEDVFNIYDISDYESRMKHYHSAVYECDIENGALNEVINDTVGSFVAVRGDSAYYYKYDEDGNRSNVLCRRRLDDGETSEVFEGEATNIVADGSDVIISSFENQHCYFTLLNNKGEEKKTEYAGKENLFIDAFIDGVIYVGMFTEKENGESVNELGRISIEDLFAKEQGKIEIIGKI